MIDIKDRFPHQLSGGEQQRVSIARAILNKPDLILADEPTGNLDPATSKEIMNLLIDINNQGSTVLMATHDYEMISNFPKKSKIALCAFMLLYSQFIQCKELLLVISK